MFFFKFEMFVTILDCNYRYSEWKHCSWDFYSSFLLPTCFIAIVTFSSILKHPNKSFFLTQSIYILTSFYHTLLITCFIKNILFFRFDVIIFCQFFFYLFFVFFFIIGGICTASQRYFDTRFVSILVDSNLVPTCFADG